MTKGRCSWVLFTTFLAVLVWAFPAGAGRTAFAGPACAPEVASSDLLERFTAEQKKDLLAGKAVFEHVLEGEDTATPSGHAKAFVLIRAPVEDCFRHFADPETHTLYFPRKTVSRVEGVKEDGRVSVYKEFDFKLRTIRFHVLYAIDPQAHRIEFNLDESLPADIEASRGYFQFLAVTPDVTLFDYGLLNAALGIRVPAFIRNYLTSRDLPQVVTNYKSWVESGGTWTK